MPWTLCRWPPGFVESRNLERQLREILKVHDRHRPGNKGTGPSELGRESCKLRGRTDPTVLAQVVDQVLRIRDVMTSQCRRRLSRPQPKPRKKDVLQQIQRPRHHEDNRVDKCTNFWTSLKVPPRSLQQKLPDVARSLQGDSHRCCQMLPEASQEPPRC